MYWAKDAVINGFVFLARTEGIDPETLRPGEGIEAQTRLELEKVKAKLEEMVSFRLNRSNRARSKRNGDRNRSNRNGFE